MTFGGEPMLFPDVVYAIHKTAKNVGIENREVITNAGWHCSEAESRIIAGKLAEAGVTKIAVSVDGFHQEHIPISLVERNVRILLDAGITLGWNPCWVISKEHKNPWNERTRAVLYALQHLPVRESFGNTVQPAGNALKWLSDFMSPKTTLPVGSCDDVLYAGSLNRVTSISISPNGSVSVCKEFAIGNADDENVIDFLLSYDPDRIPEMKAILHEGMVGILKLAEGKGVLPEPGGYYSICDMCIDLRRKMARMN
jgi:hypothetical protein